MRLRDHTPSQKSGKMAVPYKAQLPIMTRILALDSSTDACSVALLQHHQVLERFELAARSHTQQLLPMVDELLAEAGCSLSSVDALAFAQGPGSFTGLRIGLGIVQGLAFARDLPVIGVSTLRTMAAGFYRSQWAGVALPDRPRLMVALDARMQEIYWSLVATDDDGEPQCLTPEAVENPDSAADTLAQQWHEEPFWGIGAGWHYPSLRALGPAHIDETVFPRAQDVARLALAPFARGEAKPAEQAQPVYLRDTVTWKKRQRIRS